MAAQLLDFSSAQLSSESQVYGGYMANMRSAQAASVNDCIVIDMFSVC